MEAGPNSKRIAVLKVWDASKTLAKGKSQEQQSKGNAYSQGGVAHPLHRIHHLLHYNIAKLSTSSLTSLALLLILVACAWNSGIGKNLIRRYKEWE